MECEYGDGRYYQANGADGTITLWNFPNSIRRIAEYKNGTEFKVVWLYTDENNVVWTVLEDYVEEPIKGSKSGETQREYFSGWVRMSDLLLVYDHISFVEEHEKLLVPFEGQINPAHNLADFIYWDYPGSEKINETWFNEHIVLEPGDEQFLYAYFDENDRPWVYIEVYHGKLAKGWVYLDDPLNSKFHELN